MVGLKFNGRLLIVRGRIRGWWPSVAIVLLAAVAWWLLYAVWRSPHRNELATYGAFAVPVVGLVAGWIAGTLRSKTNPTGLATTGQDLDPVTDLLAMAAKSQWERAAGERGLVAEPIPVTWGRPSLPLVGPIAAGRGLAPV